jgi:hypothetical protein
MNSSPISKRGRISIREALGINRGQSQQTWFELGAVSQRLIPTGDQYGFQMRTTTMESVSLSVRMKADGFSGT